MARPRRVEIIWRDITGHGDWNDKPESLDLADQTTLGYLVKLDKKEEILVLASTREDASDTEAEHSTYPLGCVRVIIYLKESYREKVVSSYAVSDIASESS